MSVERVGGVEPETVDEFLEDGQVVLWRVREKGASEDEWSAWTDFDFESSHEFYDRSMVEVEEVKFVPLSALRLVEEELRQAREERDGARLAGQEVVAALAERTAQRNKAEADRDRLAAERDVLAKAIRWIADHALDDDCDGACAATMQATAAQAEEVAAALSPVGQDDPGQETIDGDPQPLGSTITICTGCGYIVRAGDEGFHRECDDGVLIDYERADDPGQEQGAEGGGDRAAAAADVRSQGPLLTEEDWQSFPTDPETRDTVLDYLAERGYLAVRDDDSEATR